MRCLVTYYVAALDDFVAFHGDERAPVKTTTPSGASAPFRQPRRDLGFSEVRFCL